MITSQDIANSSNAVYIFGDNLQNTGLGGQAAVARPHVPSGRAFGIPTKRAPHMGASAFFSDQPDELRAVTRAMKHIDYLATKGKRIIFFPGIGDGRAMLQEKSPRIHAMLQAFLASH